MIFPLGFSESIFGLEKVCSFVNDGFDVCTHQDECANGFSADEVLWGTFFLKDFSGWGSYVFS